MISNRLSAERVHAREACLAVALPHNLRTDFSLTSSSKFSRGRTHENRYFCMAEDALGVLGHFTYAMKKPLNLYLAGADAGAYLHTQKRRLVLENVNRWSLKEYRNAAYNAQTYMIQGHYALAASHAQLLLALPAPASETFKQTSVLVNHMSAVLLAFAEHEAGRPFPLEAIQAHLLALTRHAARYVTREREQQRFEDWIAWHDLAARLLAYGLEDNLARLHGMAVGQSSKAGVAATLLAHYYVARHQFLEADYWNRKRYNGREYTEPFSLPGPLEIWFQQRESENLRRRKTFEGSQTQTELTLLGNAVGFMGTVFGSIVYATKAITDCAPILAVNVINEVCTDDPRAGHESKTQAYEQ